MTTVNKPINQDIAISALDNTMTGHVWKVNGVTNASTSSTVTTSFPTVGKHDIITKVI